MFVDFAKVIDLSSQFNNTVELDRQEAIYIIGSRNLHKLRFPEQAIRIAYNFLCYYLIKKAII